MMVLAVYSRNANRLWVREKVDWMVCCSNCKYLYERLLLAIHQFSEPERQGVTDCEPCYHGHYFEGDGDNLKQCQSSQDFLASWSLDAP